MVAEQCEIGLPSFVPEIGIFESVSGWTADIGDNVSKVLVGQELGRMTGELADKTRIS